MKSKFIKTERRNEQSANGNAGARRATVQGLEGFGLEASEAPGFGFQDNRPVAVAQRKLQQSIDSSPRQLAQAERLSGLFGGPVQRVEDEEELQMRADPGALQRQGVEEEEELLQGKFEAVQRQGLEEEELLQGKFDPVQRQGGEEEEELLQGKFDTVQRQGAEEEELLQGRFDSVAAPVQLEAGAQESENRTGMPDRLKAGMEQLSGKELSGVRVHVNSSKPAQFECACLRAR